MKFELEPREHKLLLKAVAYRIETLRDMLGTYNKLVNGVREAELEVLLDLEAKLKKQ